jgi:hypothetical protein
MYNGSRWVAVGNNAANTTVSIAYSDDDGVNWTAASTNPFSGTAGTGFAIGWNGSYWVAGGNDSGFTVSLVYSYTGDVWYTVLTDPFVGGACLDFSWNGQKWVAVGTTVAGIISVATSTDGTNWAAASGTPNPFGPTVNSASAVTWGGNKWIMSANSTTANPSIAYSYDGETWATVTSPTGLFASIRWNGSYFLAAGYTGSGGIVATSPDGDTWTLNTSPPFGGSGTIVDISWNGTEWICTRGAVGSSGTNFAESTDGQTWTTLTAAPFSNNVNTIGTNTPFWRTTPATNTSAILKILSSVYYTTSNLV